MATIHSKNYHTDAERLWSLLGEHDTFMLTTLSSKEEAGQMRARPMAGYPDKNENCVWFLTHQDSGHKDDEIENDPHVCITYSDSEKQHFVSMSGTASVKEDVEKKKELWSMAAQAWLPEGPEDENVILIRVDVDEAEYWDGEPNSVILQMKIATAAMQGERLDAGQNAKVSL